MAISPTAEGFRAAFRRPSLTMAEVAWRWIVGATASALFLFGFSEYLNTLPVTNGDLLLLNTRQPYFVAQAIAHILRGSLGRVVITAIVAASMLGFLWIVAVSVGRIATVRSLLDYFRRDPAHRFSRRPFADEPGRDVASNVSTEDAATPPAFSALVRLNFLRAMVVVAAACGFLGAAIVAGFASPDAHPRPGLAFLLFLPLALLVGSASWTLNWILSLAGIFAVRDGEGAISAISASVSFLRERPGAVSAVTTWTGMGHLAAFVALSVATSLPLGFAGLLPWRIVALGMILVTLIYLVVADWLYMARLAGYVCIAEMPEELLAPPSLPPAPLPQPPAIPPSGEQAAPSIPEQPGIPEQMSIDRDELILSDVPDRSDEFLNRPSEQ